MPHDPALDPQNRALYGDILRAPAGYVFDCAAATTYSLDFETALVVPATLAFHAAESREETLDSPLALLEGLERLAGRIAIFCEGGRIHGTPKGASRLTALLEDTITEVAAPEGGAFHPKIWVLRFAPLIWDGPPRLRVALLSRNLTRDMSWDLTLCLDGELGDAERAENAPLVDLLRRLPNLGTGRATPRKCIEIVEALSADVARSEWDLPPGFSSVSFAVNGFGQPCWLPRVGRNLGIISPFVTERALSRLMKGLAPDALRLLGRSEELSALPADLLGRFGRIDVLDDLAETEEAGEIEDATPFLARGLHAKAYITERWSTTEITIGSGNATTAALLDGRNVEVFATLAGASRKVGTMEEQFAPERLGRFLVSFAPSERPDPTEEDAAEARLDAIRHRIAQTCLTIRCAPAGDSTFHLTLISDRPLDEPDGIEIQVWPLVVGAPHGIVLNLSEMERGIPLATLAVRDVSRWIGLRLTDSKTGRMKDFSLGARLENPPEERTAEILRSVIGNRDAFLRYLRLLLADAGDLSPIFSGNGVKGLWVDANGSGETAALLESMVRALSGDGRQLQDIERLIERLGPETDATGTPLIPEDFHDLWKTFREVMPKRKAQAHA